LPIEAGIATAYCAFASLIAWALAWITHRGYLQSASPLVKVDAEGWIVNAAISTAVLLAFVGIWMIEGSPFEHMAPYIDPVLVLVVVLISLPVPIRMAWTALMGLLNRAPPPEITDQITTIINNSLEPLPINELFVRVIQPGRVRWILAHAVLPEDYSPEDLQAMDKQRGITLDALKRNYQNVVLDMLFTTDRTWGVPMNESTKL